MENQHQIRDVTFEEDKVRSKDNRLNRIMATLRTTALEIVRKATPKSFIAQIEIFNDKPKTIKTFLLKIKFL